jgi:glycosyltransferase involved in cell wall biosynthesis
MDRQKIAGSTVAVLMPTYNDWHSVASMLPILDEVFQELQVSAHVVVIDDGSVDFSGRDAISTLSLHSISTVEDIALTRNQGNQRALAIGLGYIATMLSVDYLIVMDSDHEDRPQDIPAMLAKCAESGNSKVVFAERTQRSENLTFRAFYYAYQRVFSLATGTHISMGNFSVIPAALIRPIANIGELWNHFPVSIMRARIAFERVPTSRGKRLFGSSSMRIVPLIAHAFGGFAIYADVIAARGLLIASGLSVLIVLAGIVTIGLRLTTNLVAFGSASILVGLLALILLQIVSMAGTLLFIVSWLRMQPPMIPLRDHGQFILGTTTRWNAAAERPISLPA